MATSWVNSINKGGSISKLVSFDTSKVSNYARVYVETVKSYYTLIKSSALVADGISIVTPGSGPGQWIRDSATDGYWATQSIWYIDSTSGNDENSGTDSGHAIKTWAELVRRWGTWAELKQLTTVNILNDLLAADPMNCRIRLGTNGFLLVKGVRTVSASGTLNSRTNQNRASQIPGDITDTIQTWASKLGKLIYIPSTGASAWSLKDLNSGKVRVSQWVVCDESTIPINIAPTEVQLSGSENYQVCTLTKVNIANFDIFGQQTTSTGIDVNRVLFVDLDFTGAVSAQNHFTAFGTTISFFRCMHEANRAVAGTIQSTCCLHSISGTFSGDLGAPGQWLIIAGAGTAQMTIRRGATIQLDGDTIWQGSSAVRLQQGAIMRIGFLAVFDSVDDGIIMGNDTTCENLAISYSGSLFWGSNNTGYGIRMGNRTSFSYTNVPTVTGASGDITISGIQKHYDELPYVEDSSYSSIVPIIS